MTTGSSMRTFAQTADAIAATTKKTKKVRLASGYFQTLPSEDAAVAATFLSGRAFPQFEERVVGVGGSLLSNLVLEIAGTSSADLMSAYRRHGDLGSAAGDLLKDRDSLAGVSLQQTAALFEALSKLRGAGDKFDKLKTFMQSANGPEIKYLIKIITEDLRIGFRESLVEEAIAQAFDRPLAAVRKANMLTGDISETLRKAAQDDLDQTAMRLFHPIAFMLATPADTPEEVFESHGTIFVEEKYDGIRAQVHKKDRRVRIFSRTLDEISEFPELLETLGTLPGDFIMDGEILGWRDNRPLPFTQLQKRLGRKQLDLWTTAETPAAFFAFDLLYHHGELLLDQPLHRRRSLLEQIMPASHSTLRLTPRQSCATPEQLSQMLRNALAAGHEGVVAKDPQSLYTPGRRGGSWLKLKPPFASLDVVVTAVEYGHGKRHKVLSDYTFAVRSGDRLLNIGKAYSGLTDKEILELTGYFDSHTLSATGSQKIVQPTVVLEVTFNNIQRSKRHDSGYALRFPRIVRVRRDKPASAIDTLERVQQLYEAQITLPAL